MLPTNRDRQTNPDMPTRRLTAQTAMRAAGLAAVIFAFSTPALGPLFPRTDLVDPVVAVLLLPAGVFLVKRLHPTWPIPRAHISLALPVGVMWSTYGAVTFLGLPRAETNPSLVVGGGVLLVTALAALPFVGAPRTHHTRHPPIGLSSVHLATRIVGVALVFLALLMPILTEVYPDGGIVPAPVSLGLLTAGVFLGTRPRPRRGDAAVAAIGLVPTGSIWFMFGALNVESRSLEPDFAAMTAGASLLVLAASVAWSAWGSPERSPLQITARAAAVVIWVIAGTTAAQALAGPYDIHVEPISMALDGSNLIIEVPHVGTCGGSFFDVMTREVGGNLRVNLTRSSAENTCLSSCLAGEQILCTNFLEFTLDSTPPPGIKLVPAGAPLTGIFRVPFRWLLLGATAGTVTWKAGDMIRSSRTADSARTEVHHDG